MAEITDHKVDGVPCAVSILTADEPVQGVHSCYEFTLTNPGERESRSSFRIRFQKGPLRKEGPEGITDEALLAILLHRARSPEGGPGKYGKEIIPALEEAMELYKERAKERHDREEEKRRQAAQANQEVY